jgi:hypothetical protein
MSACVAPSGPASRGATGPHLTSTRPGSSRPRRPCCRRPCCRRPHYSAVSWPAGWCCTWGSAVACPAAPGRASGLGGGARGGAGRQSDRRGQMGKRGRRGTQVSDRRRLPPSAAGRISGACGRLRVRAAAYRCTWCGTRAHSAAFGRSLRRPPPACTARTREAPRQGSCTTRSPGCRRGR